MAEDKNKSENPEEEKKDQFDDDEDFGLPDLDYDALEEDEDDADADEDLSETEDVESLEDVELTAEEIASDDEEEDWEKELEKELEIELESEEDAKAFYEEESYEEFESGSKDEVVVGSVFGADDGSGDSFTSRIESPKSASPNYEEKYSEKPVENAISYSEPERSANKAKFVRTVVIGTLVIVAIAFALIFMYDGEGSTEEKKIAKVEKTVEKPVVVAPIEEAPKEEPVKKPKSVANTLPSGVITTLESPTSKTYIIVASFFDVDMATDHANVLAAKGQSAIIIPPFSDSRFYRVSIAEFDSFKGAKDGIEGFKGEFGADIWPLRY
ncbi:MAG: hypothetical protein ACJAVY_001189 [Marinoscillum sp.]|jgi:hypothetical protein